MLPRCGVESRSGRAARVSLPLIGPRESWALAAAVVRELTWGLPRTARTMRGWRARAERIPDDPLRVAALQALDHKRGYADGAVLIGIIAPRHAGLLLAHTSLETIVDYLDEVSEAHPTHENGQLLHRALLDAVDIRRPKSDYYRHHPSRDDGGYLDALVDTCRAACATLPSYALLRPHLVREAHRARVLGLNHELDPVKRDGSLRAWACEEYGGAVAGLTWWELSGAASATLYIHSLLALAATPDADDATVAAVSAAHWPWIALATTLLDSLVDWSADHEAGAHSYLDHYASVDVAIARTRESLEQAMRAARETRRGSRHAVIVACMAALYLSAPSASEPGMRATTASLVAAGGPLVRLLVPVLRLWRRLYHQRE